MAEGGRGRALRTPRCAVCRFDLTGCSLNRCPECGRDLAGMDLYLTDLQAAAEPTPLRTALAWWAAIMGGFILLALLAFFALAAWRVFHAR